MCCFISTTSQPPEAETQLLWTRKAQESQERQAEEGRFRGTHRCDKPVQRLPPLCVFHCDGAQVVPEPDGRDDAAGVAVGYVFLGGKKGKMPQKCEQSHFRECLPQNCLCGFGPHPTVLYQGPDGKKQTVNSCVTADLPSLSNRKTISLQPDSERAGDRVMVIILTFMESYRTK